VKVACVQIQSAVRGYKTRSLNHSFATAATIIQRNVQGADPFLCHCCDHHPENVRGASCRTVFIRSRVSAVTLQALTRGVIVLRRYSTTKVPCLHIQSAIRGYKTRSLYGSFATAATLIQKNTRKASCRTLFIRSRVSTALIQAMVRMIILRTRYLDMWSACLRLQSLIHGHIGRMQLTRSRAACIHVQRSWRGAAVRSSRAQSETSEGLGCRARADVKASLFVHSVPCLRYSDSSNSSNEDIAHEIRNTSG
jgi:hypothetical protein